MNLCWKNIYNTGISEIDNQHKKLFEISNKIYEVASLDDKFDHYDDIVTILDELKEYTKYHFTFEEKFLKDHNYIHLDSHIIEHTFFLKKVDKLFSRNIDDFQKETILEIMNFVVDWITSHILQTDMKYKDISNI